MKKYRLRKWYPSLYDDIEVGAIVDYDDGWIYYTNKRGNKTTIDMDEEELSYEDFWELVEDQEPLFTTEDGVKCFDGDEYISIGVYYNKIYMIACNCDAPYSSDIKRFKHESNADEYAWKNKRVFSYEDMMKAKHSIILTSEDIEKSAKERSVKS